MKLDTDTMTSSERFRAVFAHKKPDRVPVFMMGIPEYGDFFQEFKARQHEDFDQWTDDDKNLQITPWGDLTIPYYFGQEMVSRGTDIEFTLTKYLNEQGELMDQPDPKIEVPKIVNYWGRINAQTTLKNGYKYDWYVGGYLKTKEAIEKWFGENGWPHEHKVKPYDAGAYNEFKANFGDKFYPALGMGGSGIYEKVVFMMGQDRFAYYARKDPEFLLKLLNSIKDYQLNILKEYKRQKIKPELFWTADDMGQKGRPLLSPEMFRKFLFNIRKEVFQAIHDMGAKVVMHSCGNIVELLPILIEAKLDAWQSLEPASDIDHKFVKDKYGDKLVFIGGIDSSRELCFGTKKSVKEHVKKQIETLGKNGGYVAGPAHDFLNQKLDLVLTMRDAIYEYGKYK